MTMHIIGGTTGIFGLWFGTILNLKIIIIIGTACALLLHFPTIIYQAR